MKSRNIFRLLAALVVLSVAVSAQSESRHLQIIHNTISKMTREQRARMSSATQTLVRISETPAAIRPAKKQATSAQQAAEKNARAAMFARAANEHNALKPRLVHVSAPELDNVYTRIAGTTQSETSSAWCGNNVVVGFNDSGAYIRTHAEGNGGLSFSGVAFSTDAGKSFKELPTITVGSDPESFLAGDPVVACSSPLNFWYASLYQTYTPPTESTPEAAGTGLAVNFSSTGGASWGPPVAAVMKDGFSHFIDKEWMAVDPQDPRHVYLTYTDFDNSFSTCFAQRTAIEMVTSHDGGLTWSAPIDLADPCIDAGFGTDTGNAPRDPSHQLGIFQLPLALGSQVAVGPNGEVYVAYTQQNFTDGIIYLRKSTDHGATFGDPIAVSDFTQTGAPGDLQGYFRVNSFPSLAVDHSNGPTRGNIYIAWTDGRSNFTFDYATFSWYYQFADAFMVRSSDGGNTWTTPAPVSPTPSTFEGAGRDQFFPTVAVDRTGALAVCYYDRRNDPLNFGIDRYCSVSKDAGQTFNDVRQTTRPWLPTHDNDVFVNPYYMGDYDGASADVVGTNSGFFNSFQIQSQQNGDVYGMKVAANK